MKRKLYEEFPVNLENVDPINRNIYRWDYYYQNWEELTDEEKEWVHRMWRAFGQIKRTRSVEDVNKIFADDQPWSKWVALVIMILIMIMQILA